MALNKKEYNEFIREVGEINQQGELRILLSKTIKALRLFSTSAKILEPVKEAYDKSFIEISEKYGLEASVVQNQLDDAWAQRTMIANIPAMSGGNILKIIWGKYVRNTVRVAESYGKNKNH